jgi:hypothetical protein
MPLSLPRWRSSPSRRRPSHALEGLEPRRMLSVTLLSDGFESGALAGWTTRTYSGGGSAPRWGVSTAKSYTGTHSAFSTGSAGPDRDTYADNQHTGLVRENLSFAGYGSASLTFKYRLNTEAGYDFFSVNVIGPSGAKTTLFRQSGDGGGAGWHSKTLSLNGFAGKSDLDVEFRFDSDATLASDAPSGVWVDDVRLTADTRSSAGTIRGAVFDDADGDHVRDPGESPLSGWVVYLDQNQNRRRDAGEWWRTTDGSGRYTFGGLPPGNYYVAEELRAGYTQTSPTRAGVTQSSQFNITVHYADSSLSGSQRSVVAAAARRWSRVIVGDLPGVVDDGLNIDDLYVDAAAREVDGPGGVLAQASPSAFRDSGGPGAGLPYRGLVEVDTADVAALQASGQLLDVLTHEMAHVLGFGTIWEDDRLLKDAGGSNPRFTGPVSTAQYDAIFGRSDSSVPVEGEGGPGTHDTHWRESVLGNEIMTGFVDDGPNPISRVTVGSLADLGYVVDLAAAEDYAAPGRPPPPALAGVVYSVAVSAGQTRSGFDFGNRAGNVAPRVTLLADAPDPAAVGSPLTLTATAADPDGSVAKVEFYRESNGVAGLQTGSGGDKLVGADSNSAGGFSASVSTGGLAAGTYTYYAQATDNAGAKSAAGTSAPRTSSTLKPPVSITGVVFRDADADGARDSGEAGLPGVKVYLDTNGNNKLDTGEKSVRTDSAGRYTFGTLSPGDYVVRFITPAGMARTLPSAGRYVVTVIAGATPTDRNFGAAPAATISGRVFNDLDADGVQDAGELGAAGVRLYVDANRNSKFDGGETWWLTGSSGTYAIGGLKPGTHVVRAILQDGWTFTKYSFYTVTLTVGQTASNRNFGIRRTA